jgi:hypothetical protein
MNRNMTKIYSLKTKSKRAFCLYKLWYPALNLLVFPVILCRITIDDQTRAGPETRTMKSTVKANKLSRSENAALDISLFTPHKPSSQYAWMRRSLFLLLPLSGQN